MSSTTAATRLKIAVVQFNPIISHVQSNIAKARNLCAKLTPHSVDLVCLPEMIFTGYVYPNATSITPYLESPRTGPTSLFCSDLAARLKCHVMAGYPEVLSSDEAQGEDEKVGANSAVVYGPSGEWVGGYRKTNLYETDMTWAKPGSGFATFTFPSPSPLRTLSLGICMDLNAQPPALWTVEDGPYELAEYCLSKKANVLVLLNAWLDSGVEVEEESDWHTLNYWAARLRPLWIGSDDKEDAEGESDGHETIVIVCNRSGEENGKIFAGSSAIYSMKQGSGRPKLLDMMGRTEEGVRIWDVLV